MRRIMLSLACALCPIWMNAGASDKEAQPKLEHPDVVALVKESSGLIYRHFPTNLRLYIYDKDPPGKSTCNDGCSGAWLPVVALDNSHPMGDWIIIQRDDGRKQWAYKGHPAYVLYHDSPADPEGNGVDNIWHFLTP
jgi:predicted lipoprotein with Yx(FWY)xxD motif